MVGLPNQTTGSHQTPRLKVLALLLAFLALAIVVIDSGPDRAAATQVAVKHRVGGKVAKAWPRAGKPPQGRMARWLARQVGPVKPCGRKRTAGPRAERRKANARRRRCLRWHRKIRVPAASTPVTKAGDPGAPSLRLAGPRSSGATASIATAQADPVLLARSYQIPKDDPDYEGLVNWSWTYDTAVTASAFVSLGEKAQATQLLDQLAALQFNTGAIDIAFNVISGAGAGLYRSGNVAWLGLAAATYDIRFGSSRYIDTGRRSADFLIGQQGSDGLVRGGPKLGWSSTLHNLIAYTFFMRMAKADPANSKLYLSVGGKIADGIDSSLIVDDKTGLHFRQGVNDDVEPLDAQAIGAVYLAGRGRLPDAREVTGRIPTYFGVQNRRIQLSAKPDTYNMTWSSKEKFAGFKPYNSSKVPSVIWFEGTAEVRAATAVTGGSVTALDAESKRWRDVTADGASTAPLQSNETVTETKADLGVEYHVWPAAAAASWWILAANEPGYLIP